jgi:hypothetical protein
VKEPGWLDDAKDHYHSELKDFMAAQLDNDQKGSRALTQT